MDHLAEEINEKLHQAGEIHVAELTKFYNLPGDFLEEVSSNNFAIKVLCI